MGNCAAIGVPGIIKDPTFTGWKWWGDEYGRYDFGNCLSWKM